MRDVVEECDIFLTKVHTNENPMDMLTKVVTWSKFQHCLEFARYWLLLIALWDSVGVRWRPSPWWYTTST